MPFCPKCGNTAPKGMRFCGVCGADLAGDAIVTKPAPPTVPARKAPSDSKFFLIVLVVIVFIGIITSNHPSPSPSSSTSSPSNASSLATTPEPISVKELLLDQVRLKFRWSKGGFDNVMKANFTITNPTATPFKDFEITCKHSASSGTQIDSNVRTIYEIVKANSTWKKRDFSMGFINSQAESSSCRITDLVPLG